MAWCDSSEARGRLDSLSKVHFDSRDITEKKRGGELIRHISVAGNWPKDTANHETAQVCGLYPLRRRLISQSSHA